ncbi:MAG: hypothetical protein RMJ36_03825 [Candidatus Calescibacterium sp.]|nr:hypothetical protein [Candidatus Calescibacterium sp.]MDW8132766.1 hypothetical protein [Candidatus Calescibacterium sp.]
MHKCILCLQIFDQNSCTNCNIRYDFNYQTNSPFFNQLVSLIKQEEIELSIIAINNWIEEIEITLESSKANIPLLPDIEYYRDLINKTLEKIIIILSEISSNLDKNISVDEEINKLSKEETQLMEWMSTLQQLEKQIKDPKYVHSQIKKSGLDVDYIIEKIIETKDSL